MFRVALLFAVCALSGACNSKPLTSPDGSTPIDMAALAPDLASRPPDLASTPSDLASVANDLASPPRDLSTSAPDLAGLTCPMLQADVQTYLDTHLSCQSDLDCAIHTTPCGLPGICGTYLLADAVPGLQALEDQWNALACTGPCPRCRKPAPAVCLKGKCAAMPADRPVGTPCDYDTDCHTEGQYAGTCMQPAEFPGGYCALPCSVGFTCPLAGMTCRNQPPSTTPWQCFKDCSTDGDCRLAEGYKCCPPWGPNQSAQHVCYPGPCPN
jgi:hypothetical protein